MFWGGRASREAAGAVVGGGSVDYGTARAVFDVSGVCSAQRPAGLTGCEAIRGVGMSTSARGSGARAAEILVHGCEDGLIGIRLRE